MKYTTTLQYRRRFAQLRDTYISAQWEDSFYPEYQGELPEGTLLLKDHRHDYTEIDFNYDMQLNGNTLDITFSNVTEGRKLYHLSVDASLFQNADAYTLWYINDDILDRNLDILKGEHFHPPADPSIVTAQRHQVRFTELVNAFANTITTKDPSVLGKNSLISFFVLKKNPTVDDIVVVLIRPRTSLDAEPDFKTPEMINNNISINAPNIADHLTTFTGNVPAYAVNPILGVKNMIPEITIGNSTTSGEIITVNFSTDPNVDFVYLEQSTGWLPKLKVPVDAQGNGSFNIITTGLETGDEVRVKLGFKYWSAKATFTKTI